MLIPSEGPSVTPGAMLGLHQGGEWDCCGFDLQARAPGTWDRFCSVFAVPLTWCHTQRIPEFIRLEKVSSPSSPTINQARGALPSPAAQSPPPAAGNVLLGRAGMLGRARELLQGQGDTNPCPKSSPKSQRGSLSPCSAGVGCGCTREEKGRDFSNNYCK